MEELRQRGWSQSELSRRAGLARGTLSNIMNGERGVGENSINSIAHALGYPPETVFRAAGLLPQIQPIDDQRAELNYLFDNASDQKRDEMLRYARYLAQEAGKKPVPGH